MKQSADKKEGKKQQSQPKKEHRKQVKISQQELDGYHQKISELTDMLQRLQAEFENYKKWAESEKQNLAKYAKGDFIVKLLPIVDSFEFALKKTTQYQDFVEGMELVYSQLFELLEKEGVKKLESVNQKFDPEKHEVMMMVESDAQPDTIIEELQPGYMLGDRVLRHAKVKVAKKRDKNGQSG